MNTSIALGLIAFLLAVLSYSGFCFEHGRFLNQDEIRLAAVGRAMQSYQIHRKDTSEFYSPQQPISYSSAAEFLVINPDCCRVIDEARFEHFASRVLGMVRAHIEVRYFVRYRDADGQVHAEPEVIDIFVSSCGVAYSDI